MDIWQKMEMYLSATTWSPYLVCGVIGITVGAGLYAAAYPSLEKRILHVGDFGEKTFVDLANARNPWLVIIPTVACSIGFMVLLEMAGY